MKKYKLGLYEKAVRYSTWEELLQCAKDCGYDYVQLTVDASEARIQRIYMTDEEVKAMWDAVYKIGIPFGSMSVSALTKYAIGDPDEAIRNRGMEIGVKSIELAARLGIRTVMIPGYDIYFGESTVETHRLFAENLKVLTDVAAKEGVLVGFETMENDFMNSTWKSMKYVNMMNSPYLKTYPDTGNITNAALLEHQDVCEDLATGRGSVIELHLKESKPGIFREVPFLTGHVEFERLIDTAWEIGVRRYVTELWDIGLDSWKEDILFASQTMRKFLDQK